MLEQITETKLSCPNCGSANLETKCVCKDCHAVFRPNKPYRGKFKKHPEKLKQKVRKLYSMGYSITAIRQSLKIEHIDRNVIRRWLRQVGLPPRSRRKLINLKCPSCDTIGESVRYGYVLDTYGLRKERRFLCRVCGSFYTKTRVIGAQKYPETIKQEAIKYYLSDNNITLQQTVDYMKKKFNTEPNASTIREWLIKHNIKPRGHRGNQYT